MNTVSTYTYRRKYRMKSLQKVLRNALIAEKICRVDRSEAKYIDNPYTSQATTVIQAICGTYSTASWSTVADTLTVNEELVVAEHVYDFEQVLTAFDLFADRIDEQNYSIAAAIDGYVINRLCEDATETYSTPGGGFTTPANVSVIISRLLSKVAGYADPYKGTFLVIENTDMPGFIQAQASSGFTFADAALRNGFFTNFMGVEIYVVRTGTYVNTTYAGSTATVTNDGHRVFGVKGVATYAVPRGIQYEEKPVAGKTGKEVVTWGYTGFKLWVQKAALVVDITIT